LAALEKFIGAIMPAETQDTKVFLSKSENLYEAVMVIAKRAKQINEDQYQRMRDRQILEELDGEYEEEFLNLEEEKTETEETIEAEENPIRTAQREFLQDELEFHYEATK
jgi:DNA-directed RNA polymerase subunit K/omega